MSMVKKLAVLAAAAGAARVYAQKNPEQASKYVDQAAGFVDKQTKGKYSGQISGAAQKAKSAAGIDRPGPSAPSATTRGATTPSPTTPSPTTPGPTTPGPVTP